MAEPRPLLLWLSPEPPAKCSGGSVTIWHFLREVGKACDIHFLCLPSNLHSSKLTDGDLGPGTVVTEYRRDSEQKFLPLATSLATGIPYKVAKNRSQEIDRAAVKMIDRTSYDVAVVEHSYMAEHALALKMPCLLNMHNVESDLSTAEGRFATSPIMRCLWSMQAGMWRAWDRAMVSRFDHVTLTSESDRRRLLGIVGTQHDEKCSILPRGVECNHRPRNFKRAGKRILFVGSMSYGPNIDAAIHFCRTILPLIRSRIQDADITIVGGNPTEEVRALESIPGVTVTGWVEDVEIFYQRSDLVVIPMRSGGGVKMKLLEAMGRSMPIVTTSAGAEGIDVCNMEHLVIADRPSDFSKACIDLLKAGARREQLGRNALSFVEENHSWEKTGHRLIEAIDKAKRHYRDKVPGRAWVKDERSR